MQLYEEMGHTENIDQRLASILILKNRRQIISSSLKLGLLLAACKKAAKRSDAITELIHPAPILPINSKSSIPNSKASSNLESPVNPPVFQQLGQDCQGKFDLSKVPLAPEELSVVWKCYGVQNSGLLAFNLPKLSQLGSLSGCYIVDQSGLPIVYKKFSANIDLQTDGQLKVQFFDHLPIKEGARLAFVFSYRQSFVCSPFIGPIAFEKSFRGMPVVGFRDGADDNQIVTPEVIPTISPETVASISENFISADKTSRFYATGELSACVITDLIGGVIREFGNQYAEFNKQAIFIVYKKVANTYARTFIRLV